MLTDFLNYLLNIIVFLGPIGFLFVMVLQAIIAPIPSEIILMIGGATFGIYFGTILGGVGELLGALTAFLIAKKFGRKFVEKLVPRDTLNFADKWFKSWGKWAVLMGRLAPFVPFDGVSYFAGLTKMKIFDFMFATLIGAFPRALFYSWVGATGKEIIESGLNSKFTLIMSIVCIFIFFIALGKYYISRKYKR